LGKVEGYYDELNRFAECCQSVTYIYQLYSGINVRMKYSRS